jgi:hypothetical protein
MCVYLGGLDKTKHQQNTYIHTHKNAKNTHTHTQTNTHTHTKYIHTPTHIHTHTRPHLIPYRRDRIFRHAHMLSFDRALNEPS